MTPEETLAHLKTITSLRTQRSLEAIFEVCQEQHEYGIHDFSVSRISSIGEKRGVPRAQSIRNKTGEHYRTLIKSFSDNSTLRKPVKKPRAKDAWINEIKDPILKLLVQSQASELASTQRMLKEIIPPGMEIRIHDSQAPIIEYKLSGPERRALEYITSDKFMTELQFKQGDKGEIFNSNGVKVFQIATIDAIEKALEFL